MTCRGPTVPGPCSVPAGALTLSQSEERRISSSPPQTLISRKNKRKINLLASCPRTAECEWYPGSRPRSFSLHASSPGQAGAVQAAGVRDQQAESGRSSCERTVPVIWPECAERAAGPRGLAVPSGRRFTVLARSSRCGWRQEVGIRSGSPCRRRVVPEQLARCVALYLGTRVSYGAESSWRGGRECSER